MTDPKSASGKNPVGGKDEDMSIPIEDGNVSVDDKSTDTAETPQAETATEVEAEIIDETQQAETADADAESDVVDQANEVLADAAMKAAAEELKKVQAEAADWQDKYVRLHAEWDTYRRRMK